jgi:branched-chain amino acid transport system permease protein
MVYGILEMLNFAHGDVFMVGAFVGWFVLTGLMVGGTLPIPGLVALLIMIGLAMLFCGALGAAIERFAYRSLRSAPRLAPLIAALGVSLVLEYSVAVTQGTRAKVFPVSAVIPDDWVFHVGSTTISFLRILMIAVALSMMAALDRFVFATRLGTAMRATAEDREAASFMGIDQNFVITLTFMIGAALAGLGGVLVGLFYTQIDFIMGWLAGLKAFTAAVLGGIGNIRGAMLGGMVLGFAETFGTAFMPTAYRDVIAFSILIVFLVLKPSGLLGANLPNKL